MAALLAGQRARHHISATGYDPSRAQGRASEWEQAAGRSFVVFCAGRGWGLGKMGEEEGEIEACHYGIDESGGERHSLGNRVNGIVTALYGGRGQVHMW